MIIEYLPPSVIRSLPELALIVVGFVVEWHYVSRITVFGNSMALAAHAASVESPSPLFTAYVEVGIVLGLYGLWKYVREESIGQAYYVSGFYLYSSLPVGFLIFLPIGDPIAFLLATLAHLVMAIWAEGVSSFAYTGARPFEVVHFLRNNSVEYPNYKLGRWVEVPLTDVFDH